MGSLQSAGKSTIYTTHPSCVGWISVRWDLLLVEKKDIFVLRAHRAVYALYFVRVVLVPWRAYLFFCLVWSGITGDLAASSRQAWWLFDLWPHTSSSLSGSWLKSDDIVSMKSKRADFAAAFLRGRMVVAGGLGERLQSVHLDWTLTNIRSSEG